MRTHPSFDLIRLARAKQAIAMLCSAIATTSFAAEKVNFNRDIRPILSDKCFHCHGPDEKERKAGLRLDSREAALAGGDSGPAINPAKAEASELLVRVLSKEKDEMMPP